MPKAKKRATPAVGRTLQTKFKGKIYTMTVVRLKTGGIGYRVGDDTFATPSSAAKSIAGSEVNGWTWWKIEPRA